MIDEEKISKVVSRILRESYYTNFLGSDFNQQRNKYMARRQTLRDKLIDSIMGIIETEYANLNLKRETLGYLVDPIIQNLNKWSRR